MIYKYRSTGNASDRGRGCSIPSPSAPPPRGRYPIDALPGRRPALSRQRERSHRHPVPASWHCIRANRHALPAPSRGGGWRPRSGREVGVIYIYRSTGNASDRGRGVPPPPRQPHPYGGDIPSMHYRGRDNLSTVSVNTLPESCSRPLPRSSDQSPHTARPLWRGREEAAERPGGGGDL